MRFCFVHVQSWRPSLTRTVLLPGELSPSRCTYPSAAKERHGRRIYQSHSSLAWIAIVQRTESRVMIRALRDEGWPEHAALSPEPSGVMGVGQGWDERGGGGGVRAVAAGAVATATGAPWAQRRRQQQQRRGWQGGSPCHLLLLLPAETPKGERTGLGQVGATLNPTP